ncbi:hypothetical protein L218DRAFT_96597 [Marasmius fiardii PR-910]|nr:hypothetical protein L218DRAFT_96597 [Marasmius fiardii PR-910]
MTSTVSFHNDDVFAALTQTVEAGQYHWIGYIPIDDETGYKIHAANQSKTAKWHLECRPWDGPSSRAGVLFSKIGRIAPGLDHDTLVYYEIPHIDYGREDCFTCRVWFRKAIRRPNYYGVFVQCYNVDALETELIQKATAAAIKFQYRADRALLVVKSENAEAWS